MSSKLAVIAVVLLLLIGSWVTYTYTRPSETVSDTSENVEANMGAYAYQCANGSQFTMTPNDTVSELTLEAGSQGMFTGTVIVHKMGEGNHFENLDAKIVFGGAGEEVSLTVGTEKTTCNPVPNPDMAPWNWGDAGEGGSVQPDVTICKVCSRIQRRWHCRRLSWHRHDERKVYGLHQGKATHRCVPSRRQRRLPPTHDGLAKGHA